MRSFVGGDSLSKISNFNLEEKNNFHFVLKNLDKKLRTAQNSFKTLSFAKIRL